MGYRSGPAETPVGAQSLHSAHGALYREDHGTREELWTPNYCQTDLHSVSAPLGFVWKIFKRNFGSNNCSKLHTQIFLFPNICSQKLERSRIQNRFDCWSCCGLNIMLAYDK